MSVVPFHLDNENSSYTSSRNDFSISGDKILILDIDENQFLSTSKDGNATYNFRIGSEYRDYLDEGSTSIDIDSEIVIGPGKTVVIKTLEDVSFPSSRYGLILPKVSLLQRGLSTVASKIDPGYHGTLAITLFNHSRSTEKLKYGDKFCSLTVFDVQNTSRPYDKPSKTLQGGKKNILKKARDFYFRNIGIFVLLAIIFSIVSAFPKILSIYNMLFGKNIL